MSAGYRFLPRFVREMGRSRCRDIQMARLGRFFNILDPVEYERAKDAGIYRECSKVVGKTAWIAANFILELREREKADKG